MVRTARRDDVIAELDPMNVRLDVAMETTVKRDIVAHVDRLVAWRMGDNWRRQHSRYTPRHRYMYVSKMNIAAHLQQEAQLLLGDRATRKHAKDS